MKIENIDNGRAFDFGRTSKNYAKYRDIYPDEFYEKLYSVGVGHKGQKWLDVGTGTGVIPRAMAHFGAEIVATDISQNQINEAIGLSNGLPVTYKVMPAENSGYGENHFNVITACQCIMYVDKISFIDEVRRVIKPNGLFVKTYMSFLKEDPIASKTKELISEFNPDWTASAPVKNTFFEDWFEEPRYDSFIVKLPFTRKKWLGRTLTMRGVEAQMDLAALKKIQ